MGACEGIIHKEFIPEGTTVTWALLFGSVETFHGPSTQSSLSVPTAGRLEVLEQ